MITTINVGEKVKHKKYGEGEIVSLAKKENGVCGIMEIVFKQKTVRMQYPQAFDGFITALDESVQKKAENDLQAVREIELEKKRKEEELREQEGVEEQLKAQEKKLRSEQRARSFGGRHYQAGKRNFTRDYDFIDWLQESLSNNGTEFAETTAIGYEQCLGKLLVEEGIAYPYTKGHDAFVKELNEATLEERIDSYPWHISTKNALKRNVVELYKEYLKSQT